MKLLYVAGGHPLQEADDCLMWDKLGIDWFSTGCYSTTDKPGDLPFIKMPNREQYLPSFSIQTGVTYHGDRAGTLVGEKNFTWTNQYVRNLWQFSTYFLRQFDIIIFNFFIENYENNVKNIQRLNIPCYLKTFGMHSIEDEVRIKRCRISNGLKIIRNSPTEDRAYHNAFAGYDYIIRGSVVKDEHEISGWIGDIKKVCTFSSHLLLDYGFQVLHNRRTYYLSIKDRCKYPMECNGVGNNFINHQEKLDKLRHYRVNLVVGTPNANNTYAFVEAWIMGQPLVVFGRNMWGGSSCEIEELVTHGKDGFVCKSIDECVYYIEQLMENNALACSFNSDARAKAISIYGREVLSQKWLKVFQNEGLLNEK